MKQLHVIAFLAAATLLADCKPKPRNLNEDPCVRTAHQVMDYMLAIKFDKALNLLNVDDCPELVKEEMKKLTAFAITESSSEIASKGVLPIDFWKVRFHRLPRKSFVGDTATSLHEVVIIPLNHEPITEPTQYYVVVQFSPHSSAYEYTNYTMLDSGEMYRYFFDPSSEWKESL